MLLGHFSFITDPKRMAVPSIDQADSHFYSSFVVEYIVSESQEPLFKRWYDDLIVAASQYQGYARTDRCPPFDCGDGVIKWYSIIHFTEPEHLNRWLRSEKRQRLLDDGSEFFLAYRYKSFTTGLEGWFSSQSGDSEQHNLGPPAWKQVLAVVLGLYPTIMVQSLIFTALGIMQSWPTPAALVINNLITSSILTWLVMPRISRMFKFWLRPAYRPTTWRTDLWGLAIISALLGLMVIVFLVLPQ